MSYESTIPKNPLRPKQVAEFTDEKKRLETFLQRPDVDKSDVRKNLRSVNDLIEEQSAKQLTGQDLDSAHSRIATLEETIKKGMLSNEEMRKSPPGAVGRHIAHDKANKDNIQEWKRLQIATNTGNEDPDLANIERLRPAKSRMNMHNALVSGTEHHNVNNAAPTTVLTSSDIALITERAPPEVSGRLCVMDAEQRAIAKTQYVTDYKGSRQTLNRKK
tara:strand:- start:4810 stop:5463 length:654 start_codon:yes stop_codon:yes gene_type:complete